MWTNIFTIITVLMFVGVGVYFVIQYKKIGLIEKEIDNLEDDWDEVPKKSKNPYINNATLIKIIAKNREPIERKIYRLKQKRQFILDKLPVISWFKK